MFDQHRSGEPARAVQIGHHDRIAVAVCERVQIDERPAVLQVDIAVELPVPHRSTLPSCRTALTANAITLAGTANIVSNASPPRPTPTIAKTVARAFMVLPSKNAPPISPPH